MQEKKINWAEQARGLDSQVNNWAKQARGDTPAAAPQVATALPTPAPDPVANTWLDYIGASLYSFGSGAAASVSSLPDMANKVGLDFALNYTEQGKDHMKRYREIFPGIPDNELQVMVRDHALQAMTTDVYGRKQAGKPTTVTEDIFLLSQVPVGIKNDLDKKVAAYPTEVSESATVQTAGALGQIGGTVAIGAVSPQAAAASAFSQGFMGVYEEARRPVYNEQGQLVRDAASFGDAAVGGLMGGTATMVLEPLGARLVTGVGKSIAAQKIVNVLNRWNGASGGAGSKMVDTLAGKAAKLTAEEQAEKVFTDIGKGIGRKVIGEAVDKPIVEAVGRVGRAYFSEWVSEAVEQIFTNLGIAYATKDELDLLKDVVNSGAIGGNAGAVLRTLIETVAGARARSASARTKITSVTTTPSGDIEHFDDDGNPKSIGPRIELRGSGNFGDPLVPGKYANQIINTRGQKDLPDYIPETVSERELAVVIAREEQVDMGLALTYARMAKDTVANKLRGQPLEPVFEPTIDPTNPYSWGELSEEQAAAKYNDEYDQFLKKLDAFNENEERRRAVAQEFGADFLGATTEGDQLRLMRSMEDGRYWLQVYGDPEQTDANGIPLLPGKMPPEKVAMFQQLWQKLFNEEFALQLMEQQMQAPEQVDVKVARPRAEAIQLARSNIEIYKQLLEEQYRGTPVEAMFRSGAERNNWDRYLKRIREEENARRSRAADYFLGIAEEEDARQQAEAKAAVERGDFGAIEGDRRNQILRGLTKEAQQRAADFRQAMESRPEFFAPPAQLRPPMRAPQEPVFKPSLDPTKWTTWPAGITTEEQALAQYEAEQSQYEADLAQFRQAEAARKARIGTVVPPERGPVAGIKPQAPPVPGKDYPTADELANKFGQVEGGWRVLQDVDGAGAQVATEMSGRIDGEYEAVAYADNKPGAPIVGRHIVTGELRVWTLNQIKSLAEKRKSPEYRKQEGERVRAAIIAYQERARRAGTLVEPSASAPAPTPTPAAAAPAIEPEPKSAINAQVRAMLDPNGNKKFVFVAEGSPQPDAELVASASAKVFRVDLTGENGGVKGVLYTTDRALMMRARKRSSEPGGVTETHLDQLLYSRAQGKPTSENAQVVQRRDKNGNVVASRVTDPQDVPAVSQELQNQVPEGTTTVATPAEELTERRAKAVSEQAEQQQASKPLAERMKAAPTEVSTAVSSAIDSFVAQRSTETGADAAFLNPQRREILRTVLTRLSIKGDPQTINDLLPHVPRQAGKAPSDMRMAVAEVLAYAEQSGLVVQQSMPGGMTYNSLTANSEQLIRREGAKQPKIVPPDQSLFGRPKPKAKELPAKPTFAPVVGRVAPTVNPWKARVDAALASDPGLFEVITDEEFDLLDPTVAETQGNVRVATDEQLRLLIESEVPAGLADVPTFVKDPISGVDVVASTTLQTVRLDPKKTSVESWLVNRQLAWIELRRRAQAKILTGKLERTERSLTKYPPKSGSTYGRPVDPADPSTHLDMDRPVGHIAGVDGKAVPLFEDGALSLTVTDIPAVELTPVPISLVDINNQIRDMYNHISLPLEPLPELKGAAGIYDPKRHRAAIESAWDYGTIAHEFMHGMVAWCYAAGGDGPTSLVAKMPTSVIGEVTDLGRKLYGSEPAGGFEHEGLAEFFKIWMLRNESARLHYPATTLWFEGEVLRIDRQLGDKIVAAQKIVDQFRFQGEEARNRATALSEEQRRKKVPLLRRIAVRRFWDKFIQNYFSPYYGQAAPGGSQKMARKIARERGMSIDEAENAIELNPQTYMENLAGQAGNLLRKWTTDHMTLADGFTINSDVMSLEQAMMPMSGSRADLEMYIQLRRQEWLMNQDEPRMGPSLPRDLSGLERLRRKHGESIDIAYQNVMKWIRQGVMQYVRDNDPVFAKALADIEASGDVETWVPFQRIVWEVTANPDPFSGSLRRAMDPARVAPEIGKGPTERMSKEMVGGIAPIEPVFDSLERNLHALIVAVHKRKLLQMGSDLAKMDPRLRYICYEIRGAVAFTGEGYTFDPILNLAENQALMHIQGINAMPDVNNPDRVLISRNVVGEDGTLRPITESWHREWIEAISAMSPKHWESSNTALQVLLWMAKASTKTTKMVATGVLGPAFALLRGPLMDWQTIYHNGTFGYTGYDLFYQYPLRYLQLGVADPLLKLGTGKSGATTQLERSANVLFESTPFMGFSNRSYFKYVGLSKGQRAAEMAKIWNGDLGAVVERTMSFSARTGRQLTGEVAAKRAGWDGKSPITQVQMFAYQREYNRGATGWKVQGRHVAQLNQIIPYFGVPMTSMREALRAGSRQLGNPKTRIQYGTRMALMFGLTMALRALFEDDEAVKNLSYEEKAKNYPIPIKMDDGSTEVLMIPKAVTEFGVINLFDAAMEAHRSRDPYAWGNMSKALISTYLPNIVPGIFEATARLAFDSREQNLQQSLIDKLPMGSYELSANIGVNEEKMLPSQLMRNPYGTTAGVRIGEITGGAITPRKFDMLADAITSGALQRIEEGLRNLGLVEDLRPASAKSTAGAVPVIGSMFVKRAGVTMRSPSIRTMFTLAEHVNQALMASREQTLGIDAAANAELQYKLQNQAAALRQAWATISAINYIATYYNGEPGYEITTAQRQEMMRYAGAIADEVNAAIYNDYIPTRYDSGKLPLPVGNVPGRSLKEQRTYVEMQQPEYTPVINWPKTLGLPQ